LDRVPYEQKYTALIYLPVTSCGKTGRFKKSLQFLQTEPRSFIHE